MFKFTQKWLALDWMIILSFQEPQLFKTHFKWICSGLFRSDGRWKFTFYCIVFADDAASASANACAGARWRCCYCFRCCYFFSHWYTIFHCQPTKQILRSIVMHSGNLFKLKDFQWSRANILHWLIFGYAVNVHRRNQSTISNVQTPDTYILARVHCTQHTAHSETNNHAHTVSQNYFIEVKMRP